MAMFQKKVQVATKPLYTLGLEKTYLIVGLGNPGKKYADNRHNLGFMCVDYFAKVHEFPKWTTKKDWQCQITKLSFDDKKIILLKPTTFMNLNGNAVRALMQFYEISASNTLVIHDELDLDFGQIRTQQGGGSAGHNGLNSVIEQIGEDFGRVRIGIGKPTNQKMDGAKFVLSAFNKEEAEHLDALKREVAAILDEYIHLGALKPENRNFKT